MLIDWIVYYAECGWLWFLYGLQVGWAYGSAYAPYVLRLAQPFIDWYLLTVIFHLRSKLTLNL